MSNTRCAKRARSDSDLEEEAETDHVYDHSVDFWFADGTVVLVAQKIAYRVHQSILSRKSSVFEDMFAIPQPEKAETYEGCPVVHVSDTADDIEEVLEVLYDGDMCEFNFLVISRNHA